MLKRTLVATSILTAFASSAATIAVVGSATKYSLEGSADKTYLNVPDVKVVLQEAYADGDTVVLDFAGAINPAISAAELKIDTTAGTLSGAAGASSGSAADVTASITDVDHASGTITARLEVGASYDVANTQYSLNFGTASTGWDVAGTNASDDDNIQIARADIIAGGKVSASGLGGLTAKYTGTTASGSLLETKTLQGVSTVLTQFGLAAPAASAKFDESITGTAFKSPAVNDVLTVVPSDLNTTQDEEAIVSKVVYTVTGDFSWLANGAIAGSAPALSVASPAGSSSTFTVKKTDDSTVTITETVGTVIEGFALTVTPLDNDGTDTGTVIDHSVIPASDFDVSAVITHKASASSATETTSLASVDAGEHSFEGGSAVVRVYPINNDSVSQFLWMSNDSTTPVALSYSVVEGGVTYGPYNWGTVAKKSQAYLATSINEKIETLGLTGSRAQLEFTVNAAYGQDTITNTAGAAVAVSDFTTGGVVGATLASTATSTSAGTDVIVASGAGTAVVAAGQITSNVSISSKAWNIYAGYRVGDDRINIPVEQK